ncbi:methylmalonyl Co-A mutase-associated GTPase MeaB [Coraliomargarita akajimensis]|uniref:LAO/AO transport system ATPase n=1 Tax=Coraliomargarita akajimensis (strain DSM 45221 / IAM 15411 / JCM 23193 / KCTC 12865 / 04OKA010-24) TaxID=583355 RepID=D5EQ50_CORAD|nr:methylmalonyl Co-A mutase-associated GTPase MeaB [Coraliomargarita akajimensis]ADE53818.1 LAO/AO transport system ATPase [Coraliomargarita akajimensis DSM 45221]
MRNPPDIDSLVAGVLAGDRARMARAITLVESRAPKHAPYAKELMKRLLPHTGGSIRVGLTGVPGAGKSTTIEALGMYLCKEGKKVAVLAVDPSSSVHGGSILGDKTRMEDLCREENAFIRPSPSGNSLGGVAARTREALLICEAAGYDVVIVETVGVGQSETEVRTMTDFFLLLQIAGAGDELQGIKKGVIELADAIVVNKADGDNVVRARQAKVEYTRVLHFLHPFTPGWTPKALTCSALEHSGIEAVWQLICDFREQLTESGVFEQRRREQNVDWFHSLMQQAVMQRFQEANRERIEAMEQGVGQGTLPVSVALSDLLQN